MFPCTDSESFNFLSPFSPNSACFMFPLNGKLARQNCPLHACQTFDRCVHSRGPESNDRRQNQLTGNDLAATSKDDFRHKNSIEVQLATVPSFPIQSGTITGNKVKPVHMGEGLKARASRIKVVFMPRILWL